LKRPVTSPAANRCVAEVRRYASTSGTPAVELDARGGEADPGGVGHPAGGHDRERSLGNVPEPSFEKIIRTPAGAFSNDSIVPKVTSRGRKRGDDEFRSVRAEPGRRH
jgi:hypothetical protein